MPIVQFDGLRESPERSVEQARGAVGESGREQSRGNLLPSGCIRIGCPQVLRQCEPGGVCRRACGRGTEFFKPARICRDRGCHARIIGEQQAARTCQRGAAHGLALDYAAMSMSIRLRCNRACRD